MFFKLVSDRGLNYRDNVGSKNPKTAQQENRGGQEKRTAKLQCLSPNRCVCVFECMQAYAFCEDQCEVPILNDGSLFVPGHFPPVIAS